MSRVTWGSPGSKVKRVTRAVIWSAGKNRPVVVSVYPDGVVGTRLLGTQKEVYTRAEDIHRNAVVAETAAKRAAKAKARKKGK